MKNKLINFYQMIKESVGLFFYLLKFFFNLIYGIRKLSKLKTSPVSIFGGSLLDINSAYMQKAEKLAHMLSEANIPILTGGGPGIMQAASCGSFRPSFKKNIVNNNVIKNIGIALRGLNEDEFNKCVEDTIVMNNFYSRKWLLINYSIGFVVFPGGFGTLDELSNLLTLIVTKQRKRFPIILIGKDYWQPFINWIKHYMLDKKLITNEDFSLFKITDDVDEAFSILNKHCNKKGFKIFESL